MIVATLPEPTVLLQIIKNLIGELAVMDGLKIKPNYAALAREH